MSPSLVTHSYVSDPLYEHLETWLIKEKQYTKLLVIRNWIKSLLAEICHLNTQKYKNQFSQARSRRFMYVS